MVGFENMSDPNIAARNILVIGTTGHVGRHVAAALPGARRMSRSGAAGFACGDLTAPESLDACLDGIDTVFLVWTAPREAFAAAWERIARRARRVVFLSAPLKTPHPFFQQPNPGRALAQQIERTIESSGLEWTFLRPGMFAGNAVDFWSPQIRAGGTVRWPYLEVATAPIDEWDIAAVAVRALCEDGHGGAEYVITGPESLTQREQLEIIGRAIGRALELEELPPGEARLPRFLLDAWAAAAGRAAFVSPTFAELMGRQPRTFVQWAADHVGEFQA
jgi:uncharacterized protein YbjT (DUF2867 family)